MHIILDIDQTLVLSVPKVERVGKKFLEGKIYHDLPHHITIERPFLQYFLDELFKNFNVSIWTAGTKDYADMVLEKILRGRKPKYVFHNEHCRISREVYGNIKDLRLLWDNFRIKSFKPTETILLDDLKENCSHQPDKCIWIKGFIPCQRHNDCDKSLLVVLEMFMKIKNRKVN